MNQTAEQQHLVQYGCGLDAPSGWLNFDASPTLRLQKIPVVGKLITSGRAQFSSDVRYGDVISGLPLANGSCRAVYCSHVLEHLSLTDFRKALGETFRVLSDGGIFRGVLPDLEVLARAYVEADDPGAAIRFHEETLLGVKDRPRGLKGHAGAVLGNSQHLWMWDYKSLEQELEKAGFKTIRRAYFGDGGDEAFTSVEVKQRWDDCLGFQCRK